MGSVKKHKIHHHDTNVAKQITFDIDLTDGFSGGELFVDMLGFKTASIQVLPQATSGQSGQIVIKQSNILGQGDQVSATSTITMSDNMSAKYDLGNNITGRYLLLDISNVNWSTQGKTQIIVVAKR